MQQYSFQCKDDEIEQIIAADPPKTVAEFDLDGEKYPILASTYRS